MVTQFILINSKKYVGLTVEEMNEILKSRCSVWWHRIVFWYDINFSGDQGQDGGNNRDYTGQNPGDRDLNFHRPESLKSRDWILVLLTVSQNIKQFRSELPLFSTIYILCSIVMVEETCLGVISRRGYITGFLWSTGKVFLPKFQIWFPNEPDNADPGEECVTFHAEGKIRDVPCFYNLPFLCEKGLEVS